MAISKFSGEYDFLSNFYPSPFIYEGVEYPTVEHAFQALKTLDKDEREKVIACDTPSKAKRMGRKVKLREDWEDIKDQLMFDLVKAKFRQNQELKEMLIATGEEELIEGTRWHDNYWGNCSCERCKNKEGKNKLGKILMEVRRTVKKEKKKVLVVVDMQNDFVSGSLGTKEAQGIVENVVNEANKDCYEEIFFTRDTHYNNYLDTKEGQNLPVKHCIFRTEGWEIIKELKPIVEERGKVYDKFTFGSVQLAKEITKIYDSANAHGKGLEITFVGLCTDICVISNVLTVKAHCPEADIVVNASCCAGVTEESHKNALNAMKMCQVEIIEDEK